MIFATGLALGAAGLHAAWNLLLKTAPGSTRDLTSWGLFLFGGVLVAPIIVLLGGPGAATVPWLVLSSVIHVGYVLGLVAAYRHGDFSFAYPLARGGGALVAAIGGFALLGDEITAPAWIAILVVAIGLASLVSRGCTPMAVRDALLTAVAIGAYTLVDAKGARVSTNAVAYGLSTMSAAAAGLSVVFVARGRTRALVAVAPAQWRRWTCAGLCTAVAYTMVLVAVRHAPVGYVAMLRESSVVLGAVLGWWLLREPSGGRRLVSSVLVVVGLVALVRASL